VPERSMTPQEFKEHMAERHVATLVTLGPEGEPHAVPMWYDYRRGRLYMVTSANSAKVRHVSRDPRVALCVAADGPPARYAMLEGRATVSRDDVERRTEELYVRYEGPERGRADARRALEAAEMVVLVVEITRTVTWVSGLES